MAVPGGGSTPSLLDLDGEGRGDGGGGGGGGYGEGAGCGEEGDFFFIRPKYFRRWVDMTPTKIEVLPVKINYFHRLMRTGEPSPV